MFLAIRRRLCVSVRLSFKNSRIREKRETHVTRGGGTEGYRTKGHATPHKTTMKNPALATYCNARYNHVTAVAPLGLVPPHT